MRRRCPYKFCLAEVDTVTTPPYPGSDAIARDYIPSHDIDNRMLSGPCPASLMYLPFDLDTQIHIVQAERYHATMIVQYLKQETERRASEEPPADSTTLRGPHRIGREPPPTSPDWALGGREDEDSGHHREAIKPPKLPKGVSGHEQGAHVSTIDELIGFIHVSAAKSGEGMATLKEIKDLIPLAVECFDEAQGPLRHILGTRNSPNLDDAIAHLTQAGREIAAVLTAVDESMRRATAAQDSGENFINGLLSS